MILRSRFAHSGLFWSRVLSNHLLVIFLCWKSNSPVHSSFVKRPNLPSGSARNDLLLSHRTSSIRSLFAKVSFFHPLPSLSVFGFWFIACLQQVLFWRICSIPWSSWEWLAKFARYFECVVMLSVCRWHLQLRTLRPKRRPMLKVKRVHFNSWGCS